MCKGKLELFSLREHKKGINIFINIVIFIAVLIYLFPSYWTVITSFKLRNEIFNWPPIFIPQKISLSNYKEVFGGTSILWYAKNSLIFTSLSVIMSMIIGCLGAFSLAAYKWKRGVGKGFLMWIISLRMMPPIAIAIPIFLLLSKLGLIDTYIGLTVVYTFMNLPFIIWMMYIFFREIPNEISEAALIDGCSKMKILLKIFLPLSTPGLFTTLLLSSVLTWNEFLFATKLTSFNTRTLPVLISGFIGDRALYWGEMCAVGTIALVPMVIIAVLIQKYIIAGLTLGAVKQ